MCLSLSYQDNEFYFMFYVDINFQKGKYEVTFALDYCLTVLPFHYSRLYIPHKRPKLVKISTTNRDTYFRLITKLMIKFHKIP